METEVEGNPHTFYGPVMSDMKAMGKRRLEWDLNDWRWDGDLFRATPLNSGTSDCRSRQFFPTGSEIPTQTGMSNSFSSGSDEMNLAESDRGKTELGKRRTVDLGDEEFTEETRSLNLKLGGQVYPITEADVERWEVKSGKKTKVVGPSSNRAVCQVDDCRADLSSAKDYHRRHKVCDVHSKATRALVGNVMQRFCQQCSRFHVLQEFDEGKRSCRRRLAGHNKRRRKTHPENVVAGAPTNDEQNSNYLLISLLRMLSNLPSNNGSDNVKDQDVICQLLRSLASVAGVVSERNLAGLLSGSQDLRKAGTTNRIPAEDAAAFQNSTAPSSALTQKRMLENSNREETQGNISPSCSTLVFPSKENSCADANGFYSNGGKSKVNNFDLNDVYDDSQDCSEAVQISDAHARINIEEASPGFPLWIYQDPLKSSPPNTSGNSASTQSPSSSSGEAQSKTDRIVFKLFGKDPSDFPFVLRKQILDWLAHTPTDIESHIRPGCIILTIYLRMDIAKWEELLYDLGSSLEKLLGSSTDSFWRTGWIYARVRHRVAFVFDGHIVLDTPLSRINLQNCRIVNAKPIAVCASETVKFSVKGFNLFQDTSRLLCALEGKHLVDEYCTDMLEDSEFTETAHIQTLTFNCVIPNVIGRGFIEVEDDGLSSSFFPFIVAEKEVCSEICTLESVIDFTETTEDGRKGGLQVLETRNQALDFLHEMGWLLHRCQTKFRLGQDDPTLDLFPFERFRCLIVFSLDHDWCAVVKKLLNILFEDVVERGDVSSIPDALADIGLLHRAVRRNSKSMVEFLLRYCPGGSLDESNLHKDHYLFRPDVKGPGGLTPIHIAAGLDGSEQVVDTLTDDPGQVGLEAWKSARDSTGLTPYDYACLRGHYSYIHLVQRKINKKSGGQHVVEIPRGVIESSSTKQNLDRSMSSKVGGLETEKSVVSQNKLDCRQCQLKMQYGRGRRSLAIYRPAMLSMVAIAAVCVCVALLFKSSPQVKYMCSPFRWEMLEYGSS